MIKTSWVQKKEGSDNILFIPNIPRGVFALLYILNNLDIDYSRSVISDTNALIFATRPGTSKSLQFNGMV
ncbi:uncharacterized protein NEPG_01024 [Nematocida parisii ERTm1]|uniref:uncharacterized protein n=1 Tax=Nematocida parisii (strain ERTm1 / ATCC PRA-289) TaxID=881290 RepID=UPI000264BB1F|nr:uncharacterized protein NEPG_01024 [Nematocida parisii ERTm1]EIJ94356.1 hypothetical protein NEPG_01024 [Nematocida parisii ERTm1]|eukprot:XP_013058852.1 hypothetical protein NEPG_01024 [Nematocida parisii ERTm1]